MICVQVSKVENIEFKVQRENDKDLISLVIEIHDLCIFSAARHMKQINLSSNNNLRSDQNCLKNWYILRPKRHHIESKPAQRCIAKQTVHTCWTSD